MKKLLNKILFLLFNIIVFINLTNDVRALNNKMGTLEIYKIKTIDEVLVSTRGILEFYENYSINLETNKLIDENLKKLSLQNEIVNFALQFIGNPYVMGGNSLINGTDCSGFVQLIFSNFNINLSRTTYDQSIAGIEITVDDIEKGDIISYGFDGNVSHSAIYIGNETIIHASTPELGIRTDSMYIMPIITIRRIIN